MCAVVNEGGTGASVHMNDIVLCGKTGTAQRASNDLLKSKQGEEAFKDDAWFVGFATRANPEIVVVALYENGVHGPLAAPMVRDVIKAYYDKKNRQKQTGAVENLAAVTGSGHAAAAPESRTP